MKSESVVLVVFRMMWAPVSAFFLFRITWVFFSSLDEIAFRLTDGSYETWLSYATVYSLVLSITALALLAHLALEIIATADLRVRGSRLLHHFRYGPAVVLFLFLMIVPISDAILIEVSKHRMRSYIFGSGASIPERDFPLHNNDRGWCGNGHSATLQYLYFETAASGLSDNDPYVRARSLLMTARVRDFLNGSDPRYKEYLKTACGDPHPIVVQAAESILSGSGSSCSNPTRAR